MKHVALLVVGCCLAVGCGSGVSKCSRNSDCVGTEQCDPLSFTCKALAGTGVGGGSVGGTGGGSVGGVGGGTVNPGVGGGSVTNPGTGGGTTNPGTGGGTTNPGTGGGTTTNNASIGVSCVSDSTCGSGGTCLAFPNGYCTHTCTSDASCGGDNQCFNLGSTTACFKGCSPSVGCRIEYVCNPTSATEGVCLPGFIGSRCSTSLDCAGATSVCVTSVPNGYCTQPCSASAHCPSLSTCVVQTAGATTGACFAQCETAADCRTGYSCNALSNGTHVCQ